MKTQAQIVEVKHSHESELLSIEGVTAVDVGFKYTGGRRTDEIAIRVHVKKKIRRNKLNKNQLVPAEIEGVKTDVIEGEYLPQVVKVLAEVLNGPDTGHYDPLMGGVSIGPCRSVGGFIFAGTLGATVLDRNTRARMMLSNYHVMCIDNSWRVGDAITQPSLIDTGICPTDVAASLQRAALGGSLDAAVATEISRSAVPQIVDIGGITGTRQAVLGMLVEKRGRTTLLTYGIVDGVSVSVRIDYGNPIGIIILTNQLSIVPDSPRSTRFSDHGDSGSVVINPPGTAVGLLFAGAADGSRSLANDYKSSIEQPSG